MVNPKAALQAHPHFRLQLQHGVAIGPGKADLLQKIAELGSISQAGRAMGMGYRTAWMLVESMNRHFRSPLVDCARGGVNGGGAQLTPLGTEVLARYRTMEEKALRAIAADVEALSAVIRGRPAPREARARPAPR